MICPKCGKKVSQESIKCPNCQFDLTKAFNEFFKREKHIHNNVRGKRIKRDKKLYDDRIKITNYLFRITEKLSFKNKLFSYGISDEEWNILQFKLVSKIYLNQISNKSQLNNSLNDLLELYNGEYKFKIDILTKNLTNLINLAGINPFSKYYMYKLNEYKLSIVEGLEVLGEVIDDLLYGEIKLEDLDLKIKSFMKRTADNPMRVKYENELENSIKEYFILTGKDYFSLSYENKLLNHEFTIDDAYNIKELFLNKIILKNNRKNLENVLDNIIQLYFSRQNPQSSYKNEEIVELVGSSYVYYDSFSVRTGLKKNKEKSKKKSKKRHKKYTHNSNHVDVKSEELGSDDFSYDDRLDFEREILGDF